MRTARVVIGVVLAVIALARPWPAAPQPRETLGVITEIKLAGGTAEVRAAGEEWKPAAPLQALRAGDQVRVMRGASVVVLLSGGRGITRVDARSSPLVMAAPAADEGKLGKAGSLIAGSLGFLATGAGKLPRAVLSTRAAARPPEILAPRGGPILPQDLAFEWQGSQFARYTVRVLDASGVVFERKAVTGSRLPYPHDAPALVPGTPYRLQVVAFNQPPQETTFEVVDGARAAAVASDLRELESALGRNAPASSVAVARAGYLAGSGLVHDARLVVLAALAHDPDEPVLYTLLGALYARGGLSQQSAEAYAQAQFLLENPTK